MGVSTFLIGVLPPYGRIGILAPIFPTRIRYTAISVPYNLAVAAFGGTAPFIATYLVATTGNHLSWPRGWCPSSCT